MRFSPPANLKNHRAYPIHQTTVNSVSNTDICKFLASQSHEVRNLYGTHGEEESRKWRTQPRNRKRNYRKHLFPLLGRCGCVTRLIGIQIASLRFHRHLLRTCTHMDILFSTRLPIKITSLRTKIKLFSTNRLKYSFFIINKNQKQDESKRNSCTQQINIILNKTKGHFIQNLRNVERNYDESHNINNT